MDTPMNSSSFEKNLLAWYSTAKRDLPWRRTTDPYRILVSEMMLQQTQVDRVIPKYKAFLQSFPTVQDLANASAGKVIKLWSGLGYNRRAVKLQECVKTVVHKHQGTFPQTTPELQELPGIGPYTAAAIMAFAYNQPEIVIDTNIRRVFFRIFLGEGEKLEKLQETIAKNVSLENSRDYHNALMDFGATICTARVPKCESCVFAKECVSFKKYSKQEMEEMASRIFKTTQSKFEGSNRYYRSMVLKAVQKKEGITVRELKKLLPADKEAHLLVLQLVKDKLVVEKEGGIWLP